MISPRYFVFMAALTWSICACGDPRPSSTNGNTTAEPQGDFFAFFAAESTTELAEPSEFPLTDITSLRPVPWGGFLVVDRPSHQVRLHGARGNLLRVMGGFGQGPGELSEPSDASIGPDGRIYITEFGNGRVSVFSATGAFDTTFVVDERIPYVVASHPQGLLIGAFAEQGRLFHVTSLQGRVLSSFYERDSRLREVPYWGSTNRDYATVSLHRILIANTMVYPVHEYEIDGSYLGAFSKEPGYWVQASEPKLGDFSGTGAEEPLRRWLASFTIITGVYFLDASTVVVANGVFGAAEEEAGQSDLLRMRSRWLDLYQADGARVAAGLQLPGELLATTSDGRLLVLTNAPPGGWRITTYAMRHM